MLQTTRAGDTAARNKMVEPISGTLSGRVLTNDDKPAAAVTISLKGTKYSTITGDDGRFLLHHLPAGTYLLEVSLIAYETTTQEIVIEAQKNATITVRLRVSGAQLQQAIVSGTHNRFVRSTSDDLAKIPLKDMENSQVYMTIPQNLLTEQSSFTQDAALRNVPGVSQLWTSTDRAGFGNGSSFVLRGFQLNTYLRNGVPGNVSTTIDNANIESIEVLKGPSATLFGSTVTSYGGLINRITKKPNDNFGGEIAWTGGSYGFDRLTADINTPLDSAHTTLLRTNAAYNYNNTWEDRGYHRSFFLAPSLTYKPNDKLTLSFDAELYSSRGTTPTIFFFDATVPQLGVSSADKLNIDYHRSFISNDLSMQSTNANFFGRMDYQLSYQWRSQTNVSLSSSTSYGPMPYFYLLPGNTQLARNVWTIDGNDRALDIQQNFLGDFSIGSIRNRLVAGLDFYTYSDNVIYHEFMGTAGGTTAADLFDVVNSTGNIPNYLNFNKAKVDSAYEYSPADPYPYTIVDQDYVYSAYASDVVNITDRLLVNAALRIDHFDNKGSYDPVAGTTSGAYNQTAFSPKFGAVYQVIKDQLSLFGNYLNGFTNETGKDFAGQTFKPEQANQWEAGVKVNAFGGRLDGTVSYYDIRVSNVLRSDPSHPNFEVQDGTQISRGEEVELTAAPATGFTIIAGYAHNNNKYTKADPSVDGLRPASSGPADMANLWLSYRIQTGVIKGLGAGVGVNYSGRNILINSTSQGQFTAPAYTLVNATLFYDKPKYRLAFKVDNLTNEKYWLGWDSVLPQSLRSVTGTIAFKF